MEAHWINGLLVLVPTCWDAFSKSQEVYLKRPNPAVGMLVKQAMEYHDSCTNYTEASHAPQKRRFALF
jgi:hypothetical protein